MKIFVINLDHRSDRLEFISNQLQGYEWERFPALDGRNLSLEDFNKQGFTPSLEWVDPLLNRSLTSTEIACAITHFRLWELCVKLGEPIIILEDDVQKEQDINFEHLNKVLSSTDIVYLDHREMFPERTTDLDDTLFAPYYPYLGSAYAITPKLAYKLIKSDYKHNVIPVDELLPSLLGVNYYDTCLSNDLFIQKNLIDLQKKYIDIIPIRGAAYKQKIFRQVSRSILGSDIENGSQIKVGGTNMNNVVVFTVGTDESKMKNFDLTASKFNIKYTNLGKDVVWEGGSTSGPACGQKLNLVKAALLDLNDNDIVLFCDGYDVVFNDSIETITERFLGFNCDLLFGAEKTCWPDKSIAPFFNNGPTDYKYLNSGLYMGKVSILKQILSNTIENSSDDQYYMQLAYLQNSHSGRIKLDYENYIFQNLGNAYEDVEWLKHGQVRNKATRCCPCILHGNGGPQDKTKFLEFIKPLFAEKVTSNIIEYKPVKEFKVVSNEIIEMDFLSEEMCDKLILLAEQYGKWESMYGDKFPGQEVRLRAINLKLFNELEDHFNNTVNKVIEKYWWPTLMYGLRDAFVIKYSPGTQKSLNCHNDASMVSGIVKLNTEYTGGDTYFRRQDFSNINTKKGNIILWPGQVTHGHEGREVTSGTKYSLVIWTSRMKNDINY